MSLQDDACLQVLAVSQFTLQASLDKGSKPDFHLAMPAPEASKLFTTFTEELEKAINHQSNNNIGKKEQNGGICRRVECGAFGEKMHVHLVNDGPVTLVFEDTANTLTTDKQ